MSHAAGSEPAAWLSLIKNTKKIYNMSNKVKEILMVGALAGVAYYISRCYRQKKQKQRELRETLHFQIF